MPVKKRILLVARDDAVRKLIYQNLWGNFKVSDTQYEAGLKTVITQRSPDLIILDGLEGINAFLDIWMWNKNIPTLILPTFFNIKEIKEEIKKALHCTSKEASP